MTKKRRCNWRTAGPDDPIYTEGLQVYKPGKATFHGFGGRPAHLPPIGSQVILNPKPPQKPADDKEPPKE